MNAWAFPKRIFANLNVCSVENRTIRRRHLGCVNSTYFSCHKNHSSRKIYMFFAKVFYRSFCTIKNILRVPTDNMESVALQYILFSTTFSSHNKMTKITVLYHNIMCRQNNTNYCKCQKCCLTYASLTFALFFIIARKLRKLKPARERKRKEKMILVSICIELKPLILS